MFTGIVEETGIVKKVGARKGLATIVVQAQKCAQAVKPGDSVAVDGVCLTVTKRQAGSLTFDIMRETLRATTLGTLRPMARVNLERPLKASGRVHGHFLTGHVDAMARIRDVKRSRNYTEYRFDLGKTLAPYLVPKGSVAVDGISLTVGEVKKAYFSVYLIPFTVKATTLAYKKKGSKVNIETDILAKYVVNRCK